MHWPPSPTRFTPPALRAAFAIMMASAALLFVSAVASAPAQSTATPAANSPSTASPPVPAATAHAPKPAGADPAASPASSTSVKPAPADSTTSTRKTTAKHTPARQSPRSTRLARTARLKQAFVASKELQPMAQQLATLRTPAAYAGVATYAHGHTGEAAAAAYLALGHAYLLDKRYAEAESALAEASHAAGDDPVADNILHGFAARYPESIFDNQTPELEANILLGMNKLAA